MSIEKTKEFPQGKENYCPRCYFEDDKVILKSECKHRPLPDWWEGTKQCIEANLNKNDHETLNNIMQHIRTLVECEIKDYISKKELKDFILENKRKEIDGNMTEDVIACYELFNKFNLEKC